MQDPPVTTGADPSPPVTSGLAPGHSGREDRSPAGSQLATLVTSSHMRHRVWPLSISGREFIFIWSLCSTLSWACSPLWLFRLSAPFPSRGSLPGQSNRASTPTRLTWLENQLPSSWGLEGPSGEDTGQVAGPGCFPGLSVLPFGQRRREDNAHYPQGGEKRPTPCWVGVGEARNGHNSFHGPRASALNTHALCPHDLAPAHGPGAACPTQGTL